MTYLLLILSCLTIPALAAPPEPRCFEDIRYDSVPGVKAEFHRLDIYTPTVVENALPVLIYIHGGGWSLGDKRSVGQQPVYFTSQNIIFVSVNYRLSPKTRHSPGSFDNIFPTHANDVAKAVKWVQINIENYGGNPGSLVLMGHSAGAHLVNIISTNSKYLDQVGIKLKDISGVCSLDAGIYDVANEIRNARGMARRNMLLNAFGVDSANYEDASPLFHVDKAKHHPNYLLVYQDSFRRRYWNERFGQHLSAANVKVSHFVANRYGHAQIKEVIGTTHDPMGLSEAILNFVNYCTE